MENERIITIISAPKDHGFKNFAEARKWAKKHIVGSVQQPEIGEVNISGTAVDKYLCQKAVEKSDNEGVKEIELLDGQHGETHTDCADFSPRKSNNSITAAKLLQIVESSNSND